MLQVWIRKRLAQVTSEVYVIIMAATSKRVSRGGVRQKKSAVAKVRRRMLGTS